MSVNGSIPSGVDFVSIPTGDLERSVEFYGNTLGLRRTAYRPERNFAEFEPGNVTLERDGPREDGYRRAQSERESDRPARGRRGEARTELEGRGVSFMGDIFDTGVCHMAFFHDPDGNALMLHHRYAPRTPEA